jgi:hypothetical protein
MLKASWNLGQMVSVEACDVVFRRVFFSVEKLFSRISDQKGHYPSFLLIIKLIASEKKWKLVLKFYVFRIKDGFSMSWASFYVSLFSWFL